VVVHGSGDKPSFGRTAENGCGNPQVIEQPNQVVRNVVNTEVEVRNSSETVAAIVDRKHSVARLGESRCDGADLIRTTGGAVSPDERSAVLLAPLEVVHPDPVDRDEPAVGSLVLVPPGRDGIEGGPYARRVHGLRGNR